MTWIIDNFQIVLSIVIVFGALVFFHELGHFLLAKRAGILVREFALGFGPKIFAFKKDETRYTIRLLPLGGYVRMAGLEDPELIEIKTGQTVRILTNSKGEVTHFLLDGKSRPNEGEEVVVQKIELVHQLELVALSGQLEKEYKVDPKAEIVYHGVETQIAPWDRQFGSKTLSQRFWTILAGPLANFLLAIVLFTVYAFINGVEFKDPIIDRVIEQSPAAEAGFKSNDRILTVNGKTIESWTDFQGFVQKNINKPLQVIYERGAEQFQTTVTPGSRIKVKSVEGSNQRGVVPGDDVLAINGERITSLEQAEALLNAHQRATVEITVPRMEKGKQSEVTFIADLAAHPIQLTEVGVIGVIQARDHSISSALLYGPKETVAWSGMIFQGIGKIFTSSNALDQLGGPVAIFTLTGDMANSGLSMLIFWTAFLSVNLGIFNLLPIPVLDGGRIVFFAIEAVRGRPIDPTKESMVHFIGFAFLMLLILLVTWNDIQRLF